MKIYAVEKFERARFIFGGVFCFSTFFFFFFGHNLFRFFHVHLYHAVCISGLYKFIGGFRAVALLHIFVEQPTHTHRFHLVQRL